MSKISISKKTAWSLILKINSKISCKNNLVKINYIHDESETMRLSKNKIIYIENLKILLWVNKNFELSPREKYRLLFQMLNLLCKILLKSFNQF